MCASISNSCTHVCKFLHTFSTKTASEILAYMYATIGKSCIHVCNYLQVLNSQYIPVINVFSVNPPPILAAAWNLPPATFHTSASFVFCPNFQALSLKKKNLKSINILESPQKFKKKKLHKCMQLLRIVAYIYATIRIHMHIFMHACLKNCIHVCSFSI